MNRLLCLVFPHVWRRAHKREDQAQKYCKRCRASMAVKARKPKVPA